MLINAGIGRRSRRSCTAKPLKARLAIDELYSRRMGRLDIRVAFDLQLLKVRVVPTELRGWRRSSMRGVARFCGVDEGGEEGAGQGAGGVVCASGATGRARTKDAGDRARRPR